MDNQNISKSNWEKEFDTVRRFLLNSTTNNNDTGCCPFPAHHPGIIAAVNGIDQEMKRRTRDLKLQQKFIATASTGTTTTTDKNGKIMEEEGDYEMDAVTIHANDIGTVTTATTTTSEHPISSNHINHNSESGNVNNNNDNSMIDMDDWQEIPVDDITTAAAVKGTATEGNSNTNTTDQKEEEFSIELTKRIVTQLAAHQVVCRSPMAALAVVLHVAVVLNRNDLYVCTGIPDNDDTTTGGFAPPIRALPIGQLLPLHWDNTTSTTSTGSTNHPPKNIQFRYRKGGVGTVVLSVAVPENMDATASNMESKQIAVTLAAAGSNNNRNNNEKSGTTTTTDPFYVTIADHINVRSWDTAMTKLQQPSSFNNDNKNAIAPMLHYKQLSVLVRQFRQHFHLTTPTIEPTTTSVSTGMMTPTTAGQYQQQPTNNTVPMMTSTTNNLVPPVSSQCGIPLQPLTTTTPYPPSRIVGGGGGGLPDIFSTGRNGTGSSNNPLYHGQFDGDLYPSGLYHTDPISSSSPPGNLMGPNHPMFQQPPQHFMDDDASIMGGFNGGTLTMKPRFDPFGPPGGPTEPPPSHSANPAGPQRQPRRGGTGNPNNDLAIPPPFGGNNMFL